MTSYRVVVSSCYLDSAPVRRPRAAVCAQNQQTLAAERLGTAGCPRRRRGTRTGRALRGRYGEVL
jgi:hypothetical protein